MFVYLSEVVQLSRESASDKWIKEFALIEVTGSSPTWQESFCRWVGD